MKSQCRVLFTSYDTNGDGALQREEFRVFYKDFMKISFNDYPSEAEIQGTILDIDKNGDGEISLEEFTDWWSIANQDKTAKIRRFVTYAGMPARSQQVSTMNLRRGSVPTNTHVVAKRHASFTSGDSSPLPIRAPSLRDGPRLGGESVRDAIEQLPVSSRSTKREPVPRKSPR